MNETGELDYNQTISVSGPRCSVETRELHVCADWPLRVSVCHRRIPNHLERGAAAHRSRRGLGVGSFSVLGTV